jgi:hypothetical protein
MKITVKNSMKKIKKSMKHLSLGLIVIEVECVIQKFFTHILIIALRFRFRFRFKIDCDFSLLAVVLYVV